MQNSDDYNDNISDIANNSNMKVIEEIMNNNYNSKNNSDRSFINNDNNNNDNIKPLVLVNNVFSHHA